MFLSTPNRVANLKLRSYGFVGVFQVGAEATYNVGPHRRRDKRGVRRIGGFQHSHMR
jgi:hypothetical protein